MEWTIDEKTQEEFGREFADVLQPLVETVERLIATDDLKNLSCLLFFLRGFHHRIGDLLEQKYKNLES
jgi:hypothetical protein